MKYMLKINMLVFFVVNEEKCSTNFTFNDDFKFNEDFARLIIDEYLKDSK